MSVSHFLLPPDDGARADLEEAAPSRESELHEVVCSSRRVHSLALSMKGGTNHIHEDGVPRFDPFIFLEQLAVQCLFPLSYPYVHLTYGPQAVVTQVFDLRSQFAPAGFAVNAFWILPWVYYLNRDELNEGGISVAEMAAVMMAGFVFRCVIASKYASLGKAEYLRFLGETDPVVVGEYRKQMQLLTGWLSLDLVHMVHEAELSFARMGLYVGNCETRFRIPRTDIWKWSKLLGEEHRALLENVCVPSGSCSDDICIEASGLLGIAYTASHSMKLHWYFRALAIFASITLA